MPREVRGGGGLVEKSSFEGSLKTLTLQGSSLECITEN